jgi:hypothetical protein
VTARETPEPLTPVVAFLDKYGLANTSGERHAARKEALTLARAALRAATPDPADHDRQAVQGTHLFDEFCPGCAATPDPAEPGLRKAVTAHVACVCEQLTGEGPRPLGNGRVYHFQGCCADSDLAAALSDTAEGQS